jgi:hypothetical protein
MQAIILWLDLVNPTYLFFQHQENTFYS